MTIDQENLIKILQSIFTTKEDLRQMRDDLADKMDVLLTANDKAAKEFKDLRTEVSFFHIGQKRQDEVLNNHENRIKIVENKLVA
ncbi:MAG: hypothetical protein Q8L21_02050 [Candidatus Komeilibacteria bacterium]|nr:hypothetical protein [Candidatus Komeilibacteria bacterium]